MLRSEWAWQASRTIFTEAGFSVAVVIDILGAIVLLYLIALIGRLVLEWVQVFARDWRPQGPILVVAEGIYSVTDPPIKALRRILPPIRLGSVQIDLAITVLFIAVFTLWSLLRSGPV